jgi:hypothetical protein
VLSAHPPERLEIELQSLVGPSFAQRGYRLVGHGLTAITWRRAMSGKLIAGLVVLGLMALSGLSTGEAGSIVLGVLCAVGAGPLFYFRRPATVTISLTRLLDGTDLAISGGADAPRTEEIVRTVAGPPPSRNPPQGPEAPGSLWGPPRAKS